VKAVSQNPESLLEHARSLTGRGAYAAVVELLSGVPRADLLSEPELGYHLAYAWRRTGAGPAALRLCEELDIPVRRRAAPWLIRRRLNLEAMLRYDRGETDRARTLWHDVIEHASTAEDQALVSAANNNLGVICVLQDRVDDALAAYMRALIAATRLGDRRGIAQAHQNIAILHRENAAGDEADAHFAQAAAHAGEAAMCDDVRGRVDEERALLLLGRGDIELADATARRALVTFRRIADVSGQGEAQRVLGIIALRKRNHTAARTHLEEAARAAARAHNALLEAETMEARAVLERALGNEAAADASEQAAAAGFAAMGATPWGRRIRVRTAALTTGPPA
jgi:tetratricopeptide (TPR) repeat protein